MAVELGLSPDSRRGLEAGVWIDAARRAGFSALGVPVAQADGAAAAALDAAGLRCHEVLALVLDDDEERTMASAARLAEAAAAVRARWVLTVFRCGLDDTTAVRIRRCAAMFGEAGAGMAVEFSPMGPIRSMRAGLEIVQAAGPEHAGLLVDAWHYFSGENTWDDLATVPLERIAYVQFADAARMLSPSRVDESVHNRAMPGEGTLPLDRFVTTLLERGWEGLVDVEVLSRELRELPLLEFARRAHDTAARYWL